MVRPRKKSRDRKRSFKDGGAAEAGADEISGIFYLLTLRPTSRSTS